MLILRRLEIFDVRYVSNFELQYLSLFELRCSTLFKFRCSIVNPISTCDIRFIPIFEFNFSLFVSVTIDPMAAMSSNAMLHADLALRTACRTIKSTACPKGTQRVGNPCHWSLASFESASLSCTSFACILSLASFRLHLVPTHASYLLAASAGGTPHGHPFWCQF